MHVSAKLVAGSSRWYAGRMTDCLLSATHSCHFLIRSLTLGGTP